METTMIKWDLIGHEAGQFIDLTALARLIRDQGPGARLPGWAAVQRDHPELIAGDVTDRRRLFVSHRWDAREYPDPTGWQRQALADLGSHYAFRDRRPCIWYDYMSLPQPPRTGVQKIFSRGLDEIRRTVAACENITLITAEGEDRSEDLAIMLRRGWILFELLIARSNMKKPLPLYERMGSGRIQFGRDQTYGWDAVVSDIATNVPFDSAGLILAWFRHRRIECTNGADLTLLAGLLHEELSKEVYPDLGVDVRFDEDMELTMSQLDSLHVYEASGLSARHPGLFMACRDRGRSRLGGETVWTVRFARRPPMPDLDAWKSCDERELARHLISKETMTSPMYPGIVFELDTVAGRLKATLAPQ